MHEAFYNVSIEFFIVNYKNFTLSYIFPSCAWKVIEALYLIIRKSIVNYWRYLKHLTIIEVLFPRVLSNWRALLIIHRWAFFQWKSIVVWRHKQGRRLNNWIWIHYVNETFIFSQNNTENKNTSFSLIRNYSYFSSKNINKVLAYDKAETYPLCVHLLWILNWSKKFKKFFLIVLRDAYTCIFDKNYQFFFVYNRGINLS